MVSLIDHSIKSHHLTIRQLHADDRATWDTFTQTIATGCFMQSWAWADFKELERHQTFRYGIFHQEELVGGCIFYFYPGKRQANLLVAPGAPLLKPGFEVAGMNLLLKQAEWLAKKVGAIAFRIEPLLSEKPDHLKSFVRAPVDLLPSETLLIDLQPSEPEILAAMQSKGRYNIRLSQRYGVETTFTTDDQAIPKLYDLFWETVERQQFFGEPYGFFINLCQTLFAAGMAEIGLATWQDELLAAILVVYWGDRATYLYGGRSTNHPHVMASYKLHWAAMQQAKARGCTVYDFYGYTREPEHSYAKFSQFKRKFGGTPATTIGAHDYFFYDQLADTVIEVLKQVSEGQ
jgi:peptidoglycan pentaglycine glycine transferase (the first glycine)